MTALAADRSVRSFRLAGGRALAGIFLIALFVLPCVAGPAGAYVALLAALIGAVFVGNRPSFAAALGDPGLWLFPIAFVLIATAFAFTARNTDELMALFDFVAPLVAIPAFVLLVHFAAPRNAALVSWLALGGSFAAVLTGLYEGFFLGAERATGNSSPIFFSDLGLWLGFFALTGFFAPRTRWRLLFALGPVFGIAAALMGGTRGAVLVAGVLIPVFLCFAIFSSNSRRSLRLGAAVVLMLAAAGVAALFFDTDRMLAMPGLAQELVSAGATTDASVNFRIEFYRAGVQAIADSPLVGHGWWRRFEAAAPYMPAAAAAQGANSRTAHLHNDVLNFGAGAGLLGIVAYFLMLAAPVVGAWFSPRDSQRMARLYAGAILSAGFLAMGLTDSMFVYELPKTVFCLSAAVILGFCRDAPPWPRP